MERVIKFRGKRVDNGEWIVGFLFKTSYAVTTHCGLNTNIQVVKEDLTHVSYVVDSESVGQFTGLKDTNGVEVYEGDILHFQTYEGGGFGKIGLDAYSEVCYGNHNLTDNFIYRSQGYYLDRRYSAISIHYWLQSHKATVVGNIHDNPELLKGGSNG